ncbi:MAG: hypothetical protein RIR31_1034 [Bacteroidota bacterium]|jgi:hypothetical protein
MRVFVLLLCLLFCSSKLFTQELEGEWKGFFIDETPGFRIAGKTEINLVFTKVSDTIFQAFSKTMVLKGKDKDSAVYILQGFFSKHDVLYLEETKVLKTFTNDSTTACKQMMKLYYYRKKKLLELSGNWYTENNECGYGRISLTKKL